MAAYNVLVQIVITPPTVPGHLAAATLTLMYGPLDGLTLARLDIVRRGDGTPRVVVPDTLGAEADADDAEHERMRDALRQQVLTAYHDYTQAGGADADVVCYYFDVPSEERPYPGPPHPWSL
jgi:hypothetical protein